MKILVTGHHGYIGSVLVPLLRQAGHEAQGIDTNWFEDCLIASRPQDIPSSSKDIRDLDVNDLKGVEAVIHLAALSNDPLSDLDPALTYEINQHASVRLAELAKEAGVPRFLYSSSCSTYGAGGDALLDENAEFHPVTPYGQTKVESEREIAALSDSSFAPTFLRNATAYGFSPRLRMDLAVNEFVARALVDRKIVLKSDGTAWRPLVHVEDICRAFIAVVEAPIDVVANQAYNVGRTDDNYQIRDVARIVANAIPGVQVEVADGASADLRCYRVSCERIQKDVPTFRPLWTLATGVADLAEKFRRHKIDKSILGNEQFIRLARLRRRQNDGELRSDLRYTTKGAAAGSMGRVLETK